MPSLDTAPDEVFRRVFLSRGGAALIASVQVRRYCTALGVDHRLMEPLLLCMLSQQALDRADRVQGQRRRSRRGRQPLRRAHQPCAGRETLGAGVGHPVTRGGAHRRRCVPTLSRPLELARCLDALLAGEVMPAEVLVIDQGGDEATASVVAARARLGLPVIRVGSSERGLSAARNTGLRQVSAPWVAFADDDCVPTRHLARCCPPQDQRGRLPRRRGRAGPPLGAPRLAPTRCPCAVSTVPAVFRGRALRGMWERAATWHCESRPRARSAATTSGWGPERPGAAGEDLELIHRLLRSGALLAFDPDVIVLHGWVTALGAWRRGAATASAWAPLRDMGPLRPVGDDDTSPVDGWSPGDCRKGRWRRRDARHLREEALLVAGAVSGTRYGWRLGSPLPCEPRAASQPRCTPTTSA